MGLVCKRKEPKAGERLNERMGDIISDTARTNMLDDAAVRVLSSIPGIRNSMLLFVERVW